MHYSKECGTECIALTHCDLLERTNQLAEGLSLSGRRAVDDVKVETFSELRTSYPKIISAMMLQNLGKP